MQVSTAFIDFEVGGKFEKALEAYSEAIYCKVPPKKKAIYYCNRALVNMKCENYAIALFGKTTELSLTISIDAKDCIKNDPTYVKGYYRCGSAYVALG